MVMVDLDKFKAVNDIYGHETGDKVLHETSRRLRACLKDDELVARHGGDEFITLSCCSYQVEDGRFVVVGKRIK